MNETAALSTFASKANLKPEINVCNLKESPCANNNKIVLSWKRASESGEKAPATRYLAFVESGIDSLKHLIVAPKEDKSIKFALELDAYQREAEQAGSEEQHARLAKRLNDSAKTFANHQRESIEGVIADLDKSLRELVGSLDQALASGDRIVSGTHSATRRLSSVESISSFEELRRVVANEVKALSESVSEYHASTRAVQEKYRKELEHMRESLAGAQMAARVDGLTQLPNRTSHEYRLSETIETARKGQRASLALIDLNGFKPINDTYGHLAGDAALIEFTQLLYKHFGKDCHVARIGGDEFTIISKQPAEALERRLADHLIRAMNTPLNIGAIKTPIGFSYGVAEITGEHSSAKVTQEADERMYAFKRQAKRQQAA